MRAALRRDIGLEIVDVPLSELIQAAIDLTWARDSFESPDRRTRDRQRRAVDHCRPDDPAEPLARYLGLRSRSPAEIVMIDACRSRSCSTTS
jgi:hypothetical protein